MCPTVRIGVAAALILSVGSLAPASPVLPGGGTLSGTVAVLSDGSILYADDYTISPSGVTLAVGAVEYLIVGGGGGGGTSTAFSTAGSGGGGAGGLVEGVLGITEASVAGTVGVGGNPGASGNNSGSNGGDSVLGAVTALGGGGGAGGNTNGLGGGSGGGGRGNGTTGGAGLQPASTSGGFGNAGGTGGGSHGAGGGGGAGAAGGNTSSDNGGAGGARRAYTMTGFQADYAGGGGGGGRSGGTPGSGGAGGGGSGANNTLIASAGAPNTGGGGGGGNNDRVGAAGGSGVVYVRYAGNGPVSQSGAVSQLTGVYQGYTLHAFTTTGSFAFALNGGVNLNQRATLAGVLSGEGSLTKLGPGTLVLRGDNTYGGGTTIGTGASDPGGVVIAASSTAFGTGTVFNQRGGELQLSGGVNVANTLVLSNDGLYGTYGIRNIDGANTWSGQINLIDGRGGSIIQVDDGTLTLAGDITAIQTGRWLRLQGPGDGTVSGVMSDGSTDNLPVTIAGPGTWTFAGANTYSGITTVTGGGTLRLAHSLALQNSTLASGGVVFDAAAGDTFVLGGLSGGNNITLENDAFAPVSLAVGNNNADTTFTGQLSGAGSLVKVGSGQLQLRGAQAYAGETIISEGRLLLGGSGSPSARRQLPIGTVVTVANGAELQINGLGGVGDNNEIIGGLQGEGLVTTTNAGTTARLTIDNTGDYTFQGQINANDRLLILKDGPGTQTFTGNYNYQGTTTINAGTLLINGTHTSAGAYTVNAGGTLGGTGSIGGATTIGTGGFLAPGTSIGMFSFTENLTWQPGATLLWEFINNEAAGVDYDTIGGPQLILPGVDDGKVNLSIRGLIDQPGYRLHAGDRFTLFDGVVSQYQDNVLTPFEHGADISHLFHITDNVGWWGTWEVTAGSLILTAVPEPGAWMLVLWALACGLLMRRR